MDRNYYSETAYNSNLIPDQPASAERSWLRKIGTSRLAWGGAGDVAPDDFISDESPSVLRYWEDAAKQKEKEKALGVYKKRPLEGVELHRIYNHECFRYAVLSGRSHFWIYLAGGGKGLFWVLLVASVLTYSLTLSQMSEPWLDATLSMAPFFAWCLGVPLFCWGFGVLVINHFPKLWFKPSRGPVWELNRRTGLVTVFDYDNNGEYKKTGAIGEITAPFYEFDAYLLTTPDRQGLPMNYLYLAHRYREITINFASLVAADRTPNLALALWDYLQNFMDISKPLPDVPELEKYRQHDPVTAAYDQQTGRNPRYWIDMDDETFEAIRSEMAAKVNSIDTMRRTNLMAKHVTYVD